MGLFDRFTGDDDDGKDRDELDGYLICWSDPESGGWSPVDGWDDLNEPVDRENFRINEGDLDAGTYRLFGRTDHNGSYRLQKVPQHIGWKLEVGAGDEDGDTDDQVKRQIERLERKLEQERRSDPDEKNLDPEEALKQVQSQLALQMVQQPAFIEQYGAEIALDAFGASPGRGGGEMSVDFDTFDSHPFAASLYEAMDNPDKMGQLGTAVGEAMGSFVDGVGRSLELTPGEEGGQQRDQSPDETAGEPDESEEFEPREGVDSGASSMETLGGETVEITDDGSVSDTAEELGSVWHAAEQAQTAPDVEPEPPHDIDEPDPSDHDRRQGVEDLDGPELDPDSAEGDAGTRLDPDRCQHVKDDGDQCGNPPEDGGDYCHIDSHESTVEDRTDDPADTGDTTPAEGEPMTDAEAIAEEL